MMASSQEMLDAVITRDEARVRELIAIDSGLANAKARFDKSALHEAAGRNFKDVARLLLDAGSGIETPASWAQVNAAHVPDAVERRHVRCQARGLGA